MQVKLVSQQFSNFQWQYSAVRQLIPEAPMNARAGKIKIPTPSPSSPTPYLCTLSSYNMNLQSHSYSLPCVHFKCHTGTR